MKLKYIWHEPMLLFKDGYENKPIFPLKADKNKNGDRFAVELDDIVDVTEQQAEVLLKIGEFRHFEKLEESEE